MRRRRLQECALSPLQPCERAFHRRIPALMRRAGGGRGSAQNEAVDLNLYGLTNFSAANYLATPGNGGEPGVATGFGVATLVQAPQLSAITSNHPLVDRSSGATGWIQYYSSISGFVLGAVNGAAAFISSPLRVLVPSDVGRIFLHIGLHTGAGGLLKAFLDRDERGAPGTAISGFTPAATPHSLAKGLQFGTNFSPFPTLAHLCFRGVPTLAQLQDFFDRTRALGDLPDTIAGATVTHRWSARDELLRTIVVNGQVAPAQLTDTTTRATADALLKVGGPTVRIIDPSIDGRRVLGAQGFSTANYLATIGNLGMPGVSTGFWGVAYWRPDALPSAASDVLATRQNNPANAGWNLASDNAGIKFGCSNAAGYSTAAAGAAIAAGDLGQPRVAIFNHTGASIVLYTEVNGALVQSGAPVAVGAYTPAPTPMSFGVRVSDLAGAATRSSLFGFAGGHAVGGITQAQAQDLFDRIKATGRIQGVPGLTDHLYDLTTDVIASGVDAVPAQVLDRVGTDHLTRQGVDVRNDANAIRGVGPYANADKWSTAPNTGIQGAAGGFHIVIDVWFTKVPTTTDAIVYCNNAGNTAGYYLQALNTGGTLRFVVVATSASVSATYTITAADLNKRTRIVVNYTAARGLELWVNGVVTGAAVVHPNAYVAPSITWTVGNEPTGTQPFLSGYVEAVAGGNVPASPANIATYNADLTQTIPTIAGVTQKKWIFEQDIAAVSGALPAKSVERISGSDDLVRIGSPLVLAQRTERVWSYETSPILFGAQTFSAANYYQVAAGLAGSPAGFFVALLYMIRSQAVASNVRVAVGKRPDTGLEGWQAATSGTHSALSMTLATTSGNYSSPVAVVGAADVGKLMLFTGVLDVPSLKLRGYIKRAELSTGTTFAGTFVPSAVPMMLGRRAVDVLPADAGIEIYGFTCGDAIPTLAEIQALHDSCMAAEDIQEIPGRSSLTVSLTRDARANGGALPATLLDRTGSNNFSRAGAGPAVASQYARAWGW